MFEIRDFWLNSKDKHFCRPIALTLAPKDCSLNIALDGTKIKNLWQIFLCFPIIIVDLLMTDIPSDGFSS